METKQTNRGGRRAGAGRKGCGEPTKIVRVPESLVPAIKKAMEEAAVTAQPEHWRPDVGAPPSARPMFGARVPAGFPSPADDYMERMLDLNERFVPNAPSCFFVRATGDSMNLAGICDGAVLCVDKSLDARHNDVVIAVLDGEFTVKRLYKKEGRIELRPESSNPAHKPRALREGEDFSVWGVVYSVHFVARRER